MPTIILTGLDIQAFAIEAMQLGAQDYLIKGHIDTNILKSSIRYSIERKHLEFETNAASRAALEARRTTTEFLANMSREIRTPLNTMIGSASLLLDSSLTEDQREVDVYGPHQRRRPARLDKRHLGHFQDRGRPVAH